MMYLIIALSLIFLNIAYSSTEIVINEIQPAPIGNEPEWIELYNLSDKDIMLSPAFITDAVSSVKIDEILIKANSYTILTRDTLSLLQKRILPENALIIQAKIPIYNNTWDIATLRDADSTLIDSIYYNLSWGKNGISFERVDPLQPATSKENLKPSLSPDSATMGYTNSHSTPDYDLTVEYNALNNPDALLKIIINNIGKNPIYNNQFLFGWDKNLNTIFDSDEIIYEKRIDKIENNDSYEIIFSAQELLQLIIKSGFVYLFARVFSELDSRKDNDSAYFQFFIPYRYQIIYINEIMYDTSPEIAEFLELYNNSPDTISLYKWSLNDRSAKTTKDYFVFESPDFVIYPYDYAVIAWDNKFLQNYPHLESHRSVFVRKKSLNLNQSGDDVVLRTPNLLVQDSLYYSNKWHISSLSNTKDISLEKRHQTLPTNSSDSWTSCTDPRKATPLEKNSVFSQIDTSLNLIASPNPFSPFRKNQVCLINYTLPFISAHITATIYDINGLEIKKIKNFEFTGQKGIITWDGRNDKGYLQQSGQYILLIECIESISNNIFTSKMVLVLAN